MTCAISASVPFTEVLDSFYTAMVSTQPSHSTPTGLRWTELLSDGISETLLSKEYYFVKHEIQ